MVLIIRDLMFDMMKLKDVLVAYKQNFVSKQWGDEKYKWEAVKWFQDNWDVNASDFAEMLTRSLDKTFNLLASNNNFPKGMIVGFAKAAPEEVRAMFIALFDESKDVFERMDTFKTQSSVLLEKYGNGAAQHYQYENAISTYLWLRYPDKYYIYKFGEVKTVASELGADYRFKKGAYADNIRNFLKLYDEISVALKEDTELVNLFQSQLTDTCYPDPELKTLTIDVGFYISRYYSQRDTVAQEEAEWFPATYSPGITVDEWIKLLNDSEVFTTASLEIMKRMKDYGGQATCKQLSVKYGQSSNFYNAGSSTLDTLLSNLSDDLQLATKFSGVQMQVFEALGRREDSKLVLDRYQTVMHDFITQEIGGRGMSAIELMHDNYHYSKENTDCWYTFSKELEPALESTRLAIENKDVYIISVEDVNDEQE